MARNAPEKTLKLLALPDFAAALDLFQSLGLCTKLMYGCHAWPVLFLWAVFRLKPVVRTVLTSTGRAPLSWTVAESS